VKEKAAMAKLLVHHLRQQWGEAMKSTPPGLTAAAKILVGEELTANTLIISLGLVWILILVARISFGTRKLRLPPGTSTPKLGYTKNLILGYISVIP